MKVYSPSIIEELIVSGTAEVSGTLTTENILPSVTDQFDLGSTDKRFKDLYLSGSTIFLGDVKLSEGEDGSLKIIDANENEITVGQVDTTAIDNRLDSLETESGSIRTDFTNFTSSADNRLDSLETESGSIRTDFTNFTSSADNRLDSLETESGSIRTELNNFTSSTDNRLDSLETESGSIRTDFNSFTSSIDTAFTITSEDVVANGDLTVTGDLLVQGTQSIFNTELFSVENNIIELNTAGVIRGGILVGDVTAPSELSGSFLWDGTNDYWVAGISGSEERIVLETEFNNFTGSSGVVSGSGQVDINSTTGTLNVDKGGTGQTSYVNGELLIGNTTGNTLTKATLTAGTGCTITNGTGSITIAATGLGGDFVGPTGSTDTAIVRFNGTTGKLGQNSVVTISNAGAIVAPQAGSVIPFYFDNQAAFPSATTYHGAIVHSHSDGKMYFAHGGVWVALANQSSFDTSSNVQFNNLGVGTAATGSGAGDIRATGEITAFFSDERLKNFHGNIPFALSKVMSLSGYYFTENEVAKSLGYSNDKMQVGLSAQEVQAVLPEVVTEAPISDEYLTVRYEKLIPLLVEAIKEQQQQIEELKSKLDNK